MLLFYGFILQNPIIFENIILWWAFNVRASILYQVADVSQKGASGNMPFFGQRSRYIYKYSGLGFD